eukprot:1087295-Amphidinium_carterae.5
MAPWLALVIDGKSAHRQIPIAESDWPLQAFAIHPAQTEGEQQIYMNTVGTFGVASASYHYGRLASLVQHDFLILVQAIEQGKALHELTVVLFFLDIWP